MQAGDGLHVTENRNRPKRERKLNLRKWRNRSVQMEELTNRINPTFYVLQLDDQKK